MVEPQLLQKVLYSLLHVLSLSSAIYRLSSGRGARHHSSLWLPLFSRVETVSYMIDRISWDFQIHQVTTHTSPLPLSKRSQQTTIYDSRSSTPQTAQCCHVCMSIKPLLSLSHAIIRHPAARSPVNVSNATLFWDFFCICTTSNFLRQVTCERVTSGLREACCHRDQEDLSWALWYGSCCKHDEILLHPLLSHFQKG